MRYAKLLAIFFRTSIQTDMEYRADFFTRIIASLLGLITTMGGLMLAYHYTSNIKGWTLPQVLALLAVYYLMNGFIEMFIAPNMRNIMAQVRDGTLDFVLLKPVNAQFLASFRTINIWQAANILVGAGLVAYSVTKLSLTVGWQEGGAFLVTMASGAVVVYSFWLCLIATTFWFIRVDNIEQIMWQAFEAGRYPIEIYPNWLRTAFTYVVPVAFIITVPAQALAGKIGITAVVSACVVAMSALLAASAFWRFGLKHYTGASA